MEKETKHTLIVCGTIVAVFLILLSSAYIYSGVSPPFSTVNSGSMQHSDDTSSIGTIDTGDMVIVKDPAEYDITTYVEGSKSDFKKFGEYGDVIIYRTSTNNIIHRAMLELTLQDIGIVGGVVEYQIWHIPSLIGYDDWDLYEMKSGLRKDVTDPDIWDESAGTLTIHKDRKDIYLELTDVGYAEADVSINLWLIGKDKTAGYNGYLTKGDNATTNTSFDQNILSQTRYNLVTKENIKSVATVEIPWLGAVKLLVKGTNTDQIPDNTIYSLIATFVGIIVATFLINFALTRKKSE